MGLFYAKFKVRLLPDAPFKSIDKDNGSATKLEIARKLSTATNHNCLQRELHTARISYKFVQSIPLWVLSWLPYKEMGNMFNRLIFSTLLVTMLQIPLIATTSGTSYSASAKEIDIRIDDALNRFRKDVGGAEEFLKIAKGTLVFPDVIKAGIGIGGEYGEGARSGWIIPRSIITAQRPPQSVSSLALNRKPLSSCSSILTRCKNSGIAMVGKPELTAPWRWWS